jgi:hypothetical protein
MKPRTKIVLVGVLLLTVVALSSIRRGARPDSAGRSRGACCPFMPALDGMPLPSITNGTGINCNPSTPPATNLTTFHKQP